MANHEKIANYSLNFLKQKKLNKFIKFLNSLDGNYGIIIDSSLLNYGITDHISSYPIFYNKKKSKFEFLINKIKDKNLNQYGLSYFTKTGYFPEFSSLDINICQLSPGIIMNSNNEKHYHYEYLPSKSKFGNIHELNDCLDDIFLSYKKILNKNDKIFLSLSAGKDSRLLAAKLKEHKFDNVICYTYGVKNSNDFKISKEISKKLDFKHIFIDINNSLSKKIFNSNDRRRYWDKFFQNSCVPNMQDFFSIYLLKIRGLLNNNNNYFLNGQTADFLTGAQIIKEKSKEKFLNKFYLKHFSIMNQETIDKHILKKLDQFYDDISSRVSFKDSFKLNIIFQNYWEYNNRQSKFILQQQRSYDFFHQNWLLPFWDIRFVNFWKNINEGDLIDQKLFVKYLRFYNYKNIFDEIPYEYNVNQFPKYSFFIKIMANILSLFLNKRVSYNFFLSFNINSYHYLALGFKFYLKNIKKIRNINSLYLIKWLKEKKINY